MLFSVGNRNVGEDVVSVYWHTEAVGFFKEDWEKRWNFELVVGIEYVK